MNRKLYTYLIITVLLIVSCSRNDKTIKRTTIAMGTTMEIQVRGVSEETADNAINDSFAEIRRLDTLFSTYLTGNEMWRINNSKSDSIIVDDEVFYILKKCDEFWRETNGAFDPAVGNLIELIGFEKDNPDIPSPEKIQQVRKNIGWKHIRLIEPNILIKPKHIKLSFNACIPGYAADRVSAIIQENGINDFLVNAGGEVFAKGNDWKIGIQHPRKQNELLNTIKLDNIAVSTSGDYEQYFKKNGKRFTHIFNPITGYPANECEAVTVIAKDALTSDALSTGIFVIGLKKGMELVERLSNVEALFVDTTGAIHQSAGFEKYYLR